MDGVRVQKNLLRYRRHCRAVLQGIEQPQPVLAVGSLCDVLPILRDLATALKHIHGAGWAHRDINARNIYYFKECGLIGDLEYAKRVATDGSHEIRTGTPDFMAVEVLLGRYLFLLSKRSQSEIEELIDTDADVNLSLTPFVQNEAHDIESLWWIANYVLFLGCDNSVEETPAQEEDRLYYTESIFPSSAFVNGRINFLRVPSYYAEATSWFSISFLGLRKTLDHIRMALTSCYSEFEDSFPNVARSVLDGLHRNSIKAFSICIGKASNITISSFNAGAVQRQKAALQTSAQSLVGSLCDVLPTLRDSATALKYIHEAGWVHRDISAGNICFIKEQEARGDPGYAKRVAMDGSHQLRTGTPDFMAVEVLLGRYQFLPSKRSQSEIEELIDTDADGNLSLTPFVQNEAHDIESLWWIASFVLFFNCDNSVEETPAQEENRLYYTAEIFPSSAFVNGRLNFLRVPSYYAEATSWFSNSFLGLRITLDVIRETLTWCYSEFEGSFPNTARDVFDGLHWNTNTGFDICIGQASNITISSSKARNMRCQKVAL